MFNIKFNSESNFENDNYLPVNEIFPKSEDFSPPETGILKKRKIDEVYDEPSPPMCGKKASIAEIDQQIRGRHLSLEEEKKLKKERRLLKNRESAQQSRQRKKAYVENMEKEIRKLKDENSKLKNENNSIKNLYFGLLQQTNYLRTAPTATIQPLVNIKKPTAVQTGVALFIILFSFGIFLNTFGMQNSNEFLSTSSNNINHFHIGKTLKQHNVVNFEPMIEDSTLLTIQSDVSNFGDHPINFNTESINNNFQIYPQIQPNKRSKISVIDDEEVEHHFAPIQYGEVDDLMETDSVTESTPIVNSLDLKNNSFIYCPQAHQLQNENLSEISDGELPLISFILPSNSLKMFPEISELSEPALIEVTCKVTNINVFPYFSNDLPLFPEVNSVAPLVI